MGPQSAIPKPAVESLYSPLDRFGRSHSMDVANVHGILFFLLPIFLAVFGALQVAKESRGAEPVAATVSATDLFRTGRYAECIAEAVKGIAANEFTESHRVLKLRAELATGQYAAAVETLENALKRFPNSIELRWWGRDAYRFHQQVEKSKNLEEEIGQLLKRDPWRYSDSGNKIILGRFLLSQGVDPKLILSGAYNSIKKQFPNYEPAYLASGELALEKNDFGLAAQSFEQAIKLDPADPEAHFGLALAFAPSDSQRASEALKATLERNPNHAGALLKTVDELIDSEQYADAEKVLQHLETINLYDPRGAAYRAILAHLRYQPEREKAYRETGLKHWSTNPEVDHLIGKKLSQKYRFSEGADYQRVALKLAPDYLPAKMQLAQDLLRLGQEMEGWRLANDVYVADGYNVVAHNLVTLQQNVEKFRTLEDDGIVARMDAKEAEIYGPRVLSLLKRAKAELCSKYEVSLKSPVIVEMFPKQEDFAIRTFGLPGGAGFLGVCFGTVITANSPASQGTNPTCWESTLWHEFCHVVTLNKTRNRMPRWLSEGISVYEERQANSTWGQSMTPATRKMILGDDLVPVDQLSGAFLRPRTPQHLQFAYFESSLVVEYLIEQHGLEILKKILNDLGNGITINESLERHTGSLAELNSAFVKYARNKAEALAPAVDWSDPELPMRPDASQVLAWLKTHPNNYQGLKRQAQQLIASGQWTEALVPLQHLKTIFPDDDSDDGVYPLLARVYRELKKTAEEQAILQKFAELSDDNVEMFSRLSELASESADWESSLRYANQWLAVNPLVPAPHRFVGEAAEHLKRYQLAIDSYRALLLLDPIDSAELHHRIATAAIELGQVDQARRHALFAIEEAPRYRAAHRQYLAILRSSRSQASGRTEREKHPKAASESEADSSERPGPPELPMTENE